LDLRSDMRSCLVWRDVRSCIVCVTYHTEIGHAADYVGRQGKRQGDKETIIALSDFQQLKVDPTGNVFFTSAFCNCNLKHNRLHVEALKMCRMARINDRTRRVVISF